MKAGFTLLELLIVLVVATLIAAMVAVRLHGPYQSARFEDALRRVEFADCQTRCHASGFAVGGRIVIELDRGRMYWQRAGEDGDRQFECSLPSSARFERVVTPHLDIGSGTAHIDVSPRGASATYAIRIVTSQGTERWLMFSGATGRVAYPKDEAHARQIFKFLQAGVDAD